MKYPAKFSLRLRARSFKYAFRGIVNLFRYEHNARIHVVVLSIAIALGFLLEIEWIEWAVIAGVTGLVLVAELFNSAIEKLADLTEPNWNKNVEILKDYASAAVLIATIVACCIGGFIFIPKL